MQRQFGDYIGATDAAAWHRAWTDASSGTPPRSERTVRDWLARQVFPYPTDAASRSWYFDGSRCIHVDSAVAVLNRHAAVVTSSKTAQAAIAREHRWPKASWMDVTG